MRWNHWLLALGLLTAFAACPRPARADGLLRTDSALVHPTRADVNVQVFEQVATTTAELEFPCCTGTGKSFLFPVPAGASVTGFSVFRAGVWQDAEMTQDAPTTVEDVNSGSVGYPLYPNLDSYVGDGGFVIQLPDDASDEPVRVRVEFIQVLPYESGKIRYDYPLVPCADAAPAHYDSLRLQLDITSQRALDGFAAPGFGSFATIDDQTDNHLRVSYALSDFTPNLSFALAYGVVQESDLYVQLLTDHERCSEDGYFLLIVEPVQDIDESKAIPKYFSFVMDTSGSMDGYKLEQTQGAARFFVDNLNGQDRFNIVAFNELIDPLFGSPQAVSATTRQQGISFIDQQSAHDGTNIHDALLQALQAQLESNYARIVVLLTDGLPTVGITDSTQIVQDVAKANTSEARIFTFGVGYDVNKPLLTALAEDNRGEATFLTAGSDISLILSSFFQSIDRPVMTDAALSFGSVQVHDTYPDGVTDLFAGSQLFVLGRYAQPGDTEGTLSGRVLDSDKTYTYPLHFPECADGDNPFLPCLWAKAKIDSLVSEIVTTGYENPASVQTIQQLANKCGIQTPYTSYGVGNGTAGSGGAAGTGGTSGSGGYGSGSYGSNPDGYRSGGLEVGGCQLSPTHAARSGAWLAIAIAGLAHLLRRRAR